jgi:SAM-dependent methyltransferase
MRGSPDRSRLARLLDRRPSRVQAPTSTRAAAQAPAAEPRADGEQASLQPAEGSPPGAPGRFVRDLRPTTDLHDGGASALLYTRLNAASVAEVERLIAQSRELQVALEQAGTNVARRHMILAFGLWLGVSAIQEQSGLSPAMPPEHVHLMARGPSAAAGGLYEADLVFDVLSSVGVDPASLGSALDFGCSSGRVVRVLAAAYPDVRWLGCDPNEPAIAWAQQHLPGIEFFPSGSEPPLSLPEASLDLVYAISIWSHFSPPMALRWFEEMRRTIRPGGHLLCTTHGMSSVALDAQTAYRSSLQVDEIIGAMYRSGCWYAPEFGEDGDWGVSSPDWGTAFISPEWLLAQLCPRWRVLEFAPGRNQGDQDVYVLQRV